jgi:hypothetical protein
MSSETGDTYQVSDETTVGEALFVVPDAAEIFRSHGCEVARPKSNAPRNTTWNTCWSTPP